MSDYECASGDWSPERHEKVARLIGALFVIVVELNEEFKAENKKFTLDGVLVGHLGEVIAAYAFDLQLLASSSKHHDAITRTGTYVQIKMTCGNKGVALRGDPQHLLVLQLFQGQLSVVYNGDGHVVWREFDGKTLLSNGQHRISLKRLRELNAVEQERLPLIRELPKLGL